MKKINFRPISKETEILVDPPRPSKFYVPEWYKKIPKYQNNIFQINNGKANSTVKMCMPFLDSFLTGYIQETWCDIYIETSEKSFNYVSSSEIKIIEEREKKSFINIGKEYLDLEFTWKQQWIPQLPKGYSMLYTHPLNRYDLNFISLAGIIDNDKYYMESEANHPFYFKKNIKCIIPKGTPMFQMIPIKREKWYQKKLNFNEKDLLYFKKINHYFLNSYKKQFWTKKEYV